MNYLINLIILKKMEVKKNSTTPSQLQEFILEGRKILMKKPEGKYFIEIRFNHTDIDGTRKWRVILDGLEFHVSEIILSIPCRTESKFYEDLGGYKHHIVADSNEVVFDKLIAYIN
jgi:hypothetical protein